MFATNKHPNVSLKFDKVVLWHRAMKKKRKRLSVSFISLSPVLIYQQSQAVSLYFQGLDNIDQNDIRWNDIQETKLSRLEFSKT